MSCTFPHCADAATIRIAGKASYWAGRVYCSWHADEIRRLCEALAVKSPSMVPLTAPQLTFTEL